MKVKNAIKKLQKLGYSVEANRSGHVYSSEIGKYVLEFHKSSWCEVDGEPEINIIGVRRDYDESDPMSDYCAFTFFDNLSQAIRFATR